MRRLIFVAAIILLSTLIAPVAHADSYICKMKADSKTFKIEYKDDKITIFSRVRYKYCVNTNVKKMPFAKPKYTFTRYVFPEKDRLNCNAFTRRYDGVKHNWYFWRPYTGQDFNPVGQHIPCKETASNYKSQEFLNKDVPRLYWGPGHGPNMQPRWKVNITLQLNATGDKYYAHAQDFNP